VTQFAVGKSAFVMAGGEPGSITVVGGANIDISVRTAARPVAGDSNPGSIGCTPGGVARNVAENLSRLGHRVRLLSAVGQDLFGQSLLDSARIAGVDVSAVRVDSGLPTASYLSMIGGDGDMHVAVNDMAIMDVLTPAWLATHAACIGDAQCLVLDCNLRPDALQYLCALSGAGAAPPIFVDAVSVAKCGRLLSCMTSIHTLKVNRLEAQALCGRPVASMNDACLAALDLHRAGAANVLLSLGAAGVCWCDSAAETGVFPARPIQVTSTIGAGDALLAGMVHAFLKGLSLGRQVEFAVACAELTLQTAGANHPGLSPTLLMQQIFPGAGADKLDMP
jgi:pseudouridine kinase